MAGFREKCLIFVWGLVFRSSLRTWDSHVAGLHLVHITELWKNAEVSFHIRRIPNLRSALPYVPCFVQLRGAFLKSNSQEAPGNSRLFWHAIMMNIITTFNV